MPKKLLRCIVVFTASAVFLSACSSAPSSDPATPSASAPAPEVVTPTVASVEQLLRQAEQAEQLHQRNEILVQAAGALLDNGDVHRAGAVLSLINPNQLRPIPAQQLRLERTRFAAALHNWPRVIELSDGLAAEFNQRAQRAAIHTLRWQAFHEQQQWLAAAEALVDASRYDNSISPQLIWQSLARVPAQSWRQDQYQRDELLRGWYSLMQRLTLALDQQQNVTLAVQAWQRAYPNHAAQPVSEYLLATTQNPQQQQIAVLLPLSGPLSGPGIAIRNGMLAAVQQETAEYGKNILFLDTARYSANELLTAIAQHNADTVIGPLDRDSIEAFATAKQAASVSGELPINFHQLWLNQPPSNWPGSEQGEAQNIAPSINLGTNSFFALDSESEAEISVRWLAAKGHQNILLLGADTQRTRNTANRIERWWRAAFAADKVRTELYTASTDMLETVQRALLVNESNQRINHVERFVSNDRSLRNQRGEAPELHYELRSRQDIDAIYLLGDANQVRLVKPYIDVSLSAFGTRIPVYATSIVNEEQRSRGENDLDGVFFSDAPFVLNSALMPDVRAQLTDNMQPFNISRQRLVAMGMDALSISPKLALMQQLPGYEYQGLTGRLRISQQIVERELDWARFDGHDIKLETSHVNSQRRN